MPFMEKIVFLDRGTVTVPFGRPEIAHEWVNFDRTAPEETVERLEGATIAVTNKVKLRESELSALPQLKYIAITATGFDNVDIITCRKRGIQVSNVPGYARRSVPEHVMMLIPAQSQHQHHHMLRDRPAAIDTDTGHLKGSFFALSEFPILHNRP